VDSDDLQLPYVSDDQMRQGLASTRSYTIVILHRGPAYDPPNTDPTIWEHGRRNFELRAAGLLAVVCPVSDGSELAGICIFATERAQAERIMRGDPAVQAGVLTFEVHPTRSFAGDRLPT
jgi:hypothetical protein